MGRQIYPELDFWGIAEPYLDNWLTEQFSPLKLKDYIVENKEDLPLEMGEVVYHRDGTVGVYVKDPFGNYLEYIWYSPDARKVFLDD